MSETKKKATRIGFVVKKGTQNIKPNKDEKPKDKNPKDNK